MSLSEEARKLVLVADEELQQYLYTIISAQTASLLNTAELRLFLDSHFENPTKVLCL
jgi:hypothetical protein